MWFFGLLGFFGFIIFLVIAGVSFFKKNGKGKKHLIIAGICFVVFAIMATIDSNDSTSSSQTASTEPKQEKKVEKPKKLSTISELTSLIKTGMSYDDYEKLKLTNKADYQGQFTTPTGITGESWQAKDGYVVEVNTADKTVSEVKSFANEVDSESYVKEIQTREEAAKKAQDEAEAKAAAEKKAQDEAAAAEKARQAEAAKKASAQTIDYPHLKKNPDSYKGTYVKYTGQIVQILEGDGATNIRLSVTKDSYGYSINDIIFVEYDGTTDFVENDIVTVYGKITGDYSYTSQAGYDIHLPGLLADEVTK